MIEAEKAFDDLLRNVDLLLDRDRGEEQADVVSDFLGFLAERMTDLHRRRQEEKRSFLIWLEQQIGSPIHELSGYTAIDDYDREQGGVGRLLTVLERNYPGKTRLDVAIPSGYRESNPDRDRIVQGYERSTQLLRPILREIDLTDRLIDLVVYKLYGLTADEIQLVES